MLTIFTPTFNRAHTLPRLYDSLKRQTCFDFEWLVIDDGSTDESQELFCGWTNEMCPFPIRYQRVDNGGKLRALNQGIQMAKGEYFLILDSDDLLCEDAVQVILDSFMAMPSDSSSFIGISMIRGDLSGNPLKRIPKINPAVGYVDCSNLERPQYDLQSDMAEVFYTDKLRRYSFPVWAGEKFTPEEVVWNQMALDGYKIRWFDKIVYLCEYQTDGLTNSTWKLLRDNPMGYAMMFNHRLLYSQGLKDTLNNVVQFISCCCLGKELHYIGHCNKALLAYLLFPVGWFLSLRRKTQIQINIRLSE